MEWERIVLAGAWTSLMLIYLLGDVDSEGRRVHLTQHTLRERVGALLFVTKPPQSNPRRGRSGDQQDDRAGPLHHRCRAISAREGECSDDEADN